MVWNRLRYVRDPVTRKRVSRLNPQDEWITKEVPDLRIIDQDLWDKVKDKQGQYNKKDSPLHQSNRPVYLLSGLAKCGRCGGNYIVCSKTHLACSSAKNKGTCDNRKHIKREKLEAMVISALQQNLMDKELCASFCTEYTHHLNKLRRDHNEARDRYERELSKVKRENDKLVDAILNGIPGEVLKEKADAILARKAELEEILANTEEAPVVFHPSMAGKYHEEVSNLIASLNSPDHREEAVALFRELIEKIVLTPTEDGTDLTVDLVGDLAGILSVATQSDAALVEGGVTWLTQKEKEEEMPEHFTNRPPIDDGSGCKEVLFAGSGFGVFLPFCVGLCPP